VRVFDVYRIGTGEPVGQLDSRGFPLKDNHPVFCVFIDQLRRGVIQDLGRFICVERKEAAPDWLDSSRSLGVDLLALVRRSEGDTRRPASRRRLSDETQERIVLMRERGHSLGDISRKTGFAKSTIQSVLERAEDRLCETA
jgi:DNA-directed RNA polymerase specialized sigma24 family protein